MDSNSFKKIAVAGSGVLGAQIAFHTALNGYEVSVYDITEEALNRGRIAMEKNFSEYINDFGIECEELERSLDSINFTTNLADAVADADLLIEAVPEKIDIKKDFYSQLADVAPEKTIFATNSSTLLPSSFMEATRRPDRFLALHFANKIWSLNTAEVMRTSKTSDDVFRKVSAFATSIGMVALELNKEQPGYILNTLMVPFLDAALTLYGRGVADYKTIDKTWMKGTNSNAGPFGFFDVIGLNTVYNIHKTKAEQANDKDHLEAVEKLKTEFIDKNKLGVATGEGFYKYPNPEFRNEDFLK